MILYHVKTFFFNTHVFIYVEINVKDDRFFLSNLSMSENTRAGGIMILTIPLGNYN